MKKRHGGLAGLGYILFALAVGAAAFGFAYLIAESNLPDWVKFWLLK